MEEGDVELGPVDIDNTVKRLLNYAAEKAKDRSKHHSGSIYMVPSVYRKLSPSSYTPRVVSIGPLHHEDEHLKGFEGEKATYMHNLFHKVLHPLGSTPEQMIKACVTRVSGSIDKIKARYIGMKTCPDSKLVRMMVTDACFILAFLSFDTVGPIDLLHAQICIDMVIIENQIPFFVLQDVFECTYMKLCPELPLAKLINVIHEFCKIFDGDLVPVKSGISTTHDHILGFLHKFYQNPDRASSRLQKMVKAHSVVELDRSGVRFSNKLNATWPMEMELEFTSWFLCFPLSWSKPTLKMPVLRMQDCSELFIRNLIIYEHAPEVPKCVTSYMYAMDYLIDTPEDVAKLVRSKVLVNYIGSNEEAADTINNICKEAPFIDFFYENEWKKMDEYYNANWPKRIAELRRKYFSNPWSIIALIAGILLFVLTVVQTVYGVMAA